MKPWADLRSDRLSAAAWRNASGAVALIVALALPILIGLAGLGVDGAMWLTARRDLQTAADAAAIAGATEIAAGSGRVQQSAREDAARNGFVEGPGNEIIVNRPPTSGPSTGNNSAVEVTIRRPVELLFSRLYVSAPFRIEVRAVANAVAQDEFCLLALDPRLDDAVGLQGNGQLEVEGCGVAVNSSSDRALSLVGNPKAEIKDGTAAVVGNILAQGGATLTTATPPETGSLPAADPLANLAVPAFAGCDSGPPTPTITTDTTLLPGVYCGGLKVTSNANVVFSPGVYILDGGDFTITGGANIKGTGVTIIFASSGAADVGSLSLAGHSDIELDAPTTGPFAGISFFQDRNAPATARHSIVGTRKGGTNTKLEINGTIYFPAQELFVAGDAELEAEATGGGCLKIIARQITIAGRGELELECKNNLATPSIGRRVVKLVE